MGTPSPDLPTNSEAVTIPTRTPLEQKRLAEELATIERDRGRDTLRAIEAILLECAQTPQDRFLAENAVLRLEAQRRLYKKTISNVLENPPISIENPKANFIDALRFLLWDRRGVKPIHSQLDRFKNGEEKLHINFLIFSPMIINDFSISGIIGDSFPPSDQYLTRVIRGLTSSEATLPTIQNTYRPYPTVMKGVRIGILSSKYPNENETSALFSPSALEKIINYTPSPAPASPQGTA